MKGPVIGLPAEIPFRSDREYTFCRICGALYQPPQERLPAEKYTQEAIRKSAKLQRGWALEHNKTHPLWEHRQLELSGRFLTPEATLALVPYGVIPLTDLVMSDENEAAGLEAPRLSNFTQYQWDDSKKAPAE